MEDPNTHLILVATQKCIDSGKLNKLADVLTCPDNKVCLIIFLKLCKCQTCIVSLHRSVPRGKNLFFTVTTFARNCCQISRP